MLKSGERERLKLREKRWEILMLEREREMWNESVRLGEKKRECGEIEEKKERGR
jgi:hypothetical protein